MNSLWSKIGALAGVLMLPASFGGFLLIGTGGFAAQPGTSVEEVRRIVSVPAPASVSLGLYLDWLGGLLLVIFAARLWASLRKAEGSPAWLSTGAFGAALLADAASFGDKIAFHAIFGRAGGGLDATIATSLYDVAAGSFALFGLFFALFLGLASVVILRTGALPAWIGWLGAAGALIGIIGTAPGLQPIGQAAFPVSLVWTLAVSLTLLLRHDV